MIHKLSGNKGMALPLVLIITAVVMILGQALLSISSAETNFSTRQVKQVQAQYIARAGADAAAKYVQMNPNFSVTGLAATTLDNGTYSVTLTKKLNAAAFIESVQIESTGTVGNIDEKVSLTMARVTYDDLFKGIRQTGDTILDLEAVNITYDPGNTVQIEGNVDDIDTEILLDEDAENDPNIIQEINQKPIAPVKVPVLTDYEDIENINGSYTFDQGDYIIGRLASNNGERFIFETDGKEQIIIVDELDMKGDLVINGGGNVHLYIQEDSSIDTPGDVNPESSSKLFIYVLPGKTLQFQSNVKTIRAYIYAPEANINIQSSQTLIAGAIVGNLILRNGVNGGHGNFKYIPLENNPEHVGMIGFKKGYYSN